MTSTAIILAFVGGISLAVALYKLTQVLLNLFVNRRSLTARSRIAMDTIGLALDQRSIFRLEVQSGELKGNKGQGVCSQITDKWLVLDMGDAFSASQWDGEEVMVLFQTTFKRKASFFQFQGRILSVHRKSRGILLRMAIPSQLNPGQKRSFLRISPHKDSILGAGIWPIPDSQPLPTSVHDLPPALCNYRPGRPETLHLNNISAGGMRFGVSITMDLEEIMALDKGSQLLCLLVLKPMEEGKKPLAMWLTCSITAAGQPENKFRYFGAKFTNWALKESGGESIHWFPITKDRSVPPLATWVMRHHMEQSKMF